MLDGRQHFEQVSNWLSPEHNLERDNYKTRKAIKNGYTVIRIGQQDIFSDKINWKTKLKELLIEHDTPTQIFISDDDKYKNHC